MVVPVVMIGREIVTDDDEDISVGEVSDSETDQIVVNYFDLVTFNSWKCG